MTKANVKALLLGVALAIASTTAFAQSYGPYANGENRQTALGAGGTAGTHPTGANVGPGRAAMDHTTGE
jgi:hypothetical protein